MKGVTMQTQLGTERPVEVDDMVQSLSTKRCYAVSGINPETGRPNLWKHGWPRIRNADPRRYRILERPRPGQTMDELRAEVDRG